MKNSFPPDSELRKDEIRVNEKPITCPVCGSNKIASYLYGLPFFSEKLKKELNEGTIKLGGCCVSDDDPFCACLECHTDFYRVI
jgi:transcription elongation factor Elf1